jgi:hypothetical protein
MFFFDERSEYLARVDESIARLLSFAPTAAPLRAALDCVAQQGRAMNLAEDSSSATVIPLSLLGVRVDVRCVYKRCADSISSFYSASVVPTLDASPEVIVWCDWKDADRQLFRSRPTESDGVPIEGVAVQTLRSGRKPWNSSLPPIPALASWPFKDRFVALHAAAVRTVRGDGIIIAGDRGSGKSTTALALSNLLGAELLGDETAFIHCRTTIVEPFPHAVGVWRQGRKVQVPITELCTRIGHQPVPISQIVFLQHDDDCDGQLRRLTHSDSLRELLPHHRDAGASMGDSMQTLLGLAARVESWLVRYSRREELTDLVGGLVSG